MFPENFGHLNPNTSVAVHPSLNINIAIHPSQHKHFSTPFPEKTLQYTVP